jgi:hypothetical protein
LPSPIVSGDAGTRVSGPTYTPTLIVVLVLCHLIRFTAVSAFDTVNASGNNFIHNDTITLPLGYPQKV